MLELFVLLAEPEVRVGGHDPVVLGKVLQLHRPRSFDHGIRETDKVCRMVSAHTMVAARFGTGGAVELAQYNESKEDENEDYDGDGDANQDCCVVGVCADPLTPCRLTELVSS